MVDQSADLRKRELPWRPRGLRDKESCRSFKNLEPPSSLSALPKHFPTPHPTSMNSTDAPHMIEYATKSLDFTPHDSKWLPGSARIVCCGISPSSKGAIRIYELEREGTKDLLHDHSFRPQGIKCSTFGARQPGEQNIAMGDYAGDLAICDLERQGKSGEIFSVHAHEGIVNSIDGIGGTTCGVPELATGGKDGCVKIWDPRVDKAVVTLNPEKLSSARDCWAVAFGNSHNNEERSLMAGFDNGDIKLYDLRTNMIRWEDNVKNGVTSIQFDRPDIEMNKIVVTTLESKCRCYDMRTQHSTDGFAFKSEVAHRSTVWIAKHLPQNRDVFMTGGGNGGFNIYKYRYPKNRVGKHTQDGAPIGIAGSVELLNSRVISTQPITSFDWSPDREGLCCMSTLDQTMRLVVTMWLCIDVLLLLMRNVLNS